MIGAGYLFVFLALPACTPSTQIAAAPPHSVPLSSTLPSFATFRDGTKMHPRDQRLYAIIRVQLIPGTLRCLQSLRVRHCTPAEFDNTHKTNSLSSRASNLSQHGYGFANIALPILGNILSVTISLCLPAYISTNKKPTENAGVVRNIR